MQNDKMVAEYLVQSLKDDLDDLEDRYAQLNSDYKRSYRECDLLQRNHERIRKEYQSLQQSVKSKCELIERNGLTIANHLDQRSTKDGIHDYTSKLYIKDTSYANRLDIPISDNRLNYKSDDIKQFKQNGYHNQELTNNVNNGLSNGFLRSNGQLNNAQSNGYKSNSNSELTNGYNKSSLPNGLSDSFTNSLNSSIHSNHHSSSSYNKDKRYIDQSLCSSLSSTNDKISCSSASLIFSEELHQLLTYIEGKTLNEKINFMLHDKITKMQRIKSLKSSLDDEKIKSIKLESLSLINGKHLNGDIHRRIDSSEDGKQTIDSCKKELDVLSRQMQKLSETKSQIDKEILQLKSRLQTMEDCENELKTEKRKILRELRESQTKIEELDTENYHLKKRTDKLSKNTKISSNMFD